MQQCIPKSQVDQAALLKEGDSLLFQQKRLIVAWDRRPEQNWRVGRDRWSHSTKGLGQIQEPN